VTGAAVNLYARLDAVPPCFLLVRVVSRDCMGVLALILPRSSPARFKRLSYNTGTRSIKGTMDESDVQPRSAPAFLPPRMGALGIWLFPTPHRRKLSWALQTRLSLSFIRGCAVSQGTRSLYLEATVGLHSVLPVRFQQILLSISFFLVCAGSTGCFMNGARILVSQRGWCRLTGWARPSHPW